MEKNPLMRNCFAIGVMLLFVGGCVFPTLAQNTLKPWMSDVPNLSPLPGSNDGRNSNGTWFFCDNSAHHLSRNGTFIGHSPGNKTLSGGTWIPTQSYPWWVASRYEIWKINFTGQYMQVTQNCSVRIKDLAFDPSTNTLYGISVQDPLTVLYTINISTGNATFVGTMSVGTNRVLACLAIDENGHAYGMDVLLSGNSQLYEINLQNASTRVIGSLGINCCYQLDGEFDLHVEPNVLYIIAYVYPAGTMGLYSVNTTIGVTTFLGSYPSSLMSMSFAISHHHWSLNAPPYTPNKPTGVTSGQTGITYTFSTQTSDPEGNQIYYRWDWGDGTLSPWLGPYTSGATVSAQKSWVNKGTYAVKVKAKDNYSSESHWSSPLSIIISEPNKPPNMPDKPTGETSGETGITYTFSTLTTDPDENKVYYQWDWGDGNVSDWLGPFDSGVTVTAQNSWVSKGTYAVKVKAKDSYDLESQWSSPLSIMIKIGPIIKIGAITGERGKVSLEIKNTGETAATDTTWKIQLSGGLIILGKETTGNIAIIAGGGNAVVASKFILGLGRTLVKVTADTETKSVNATVLLVFIKI